MSRDVSTLPINQRFAHLLAVISSPRFLNMEGLNSEVPFFICPYAPSETVEMERLQRQLINSLSQQGVQVLEINLYDLCIELLKEREIWEQVLEIEPTVNKAEFKELLQGVFDPEDNLIPAISVKITQQPFDVMFLTGIGEVFPYIRSHNVLNNLQRAAKDWPTLMFFPGTYSHSAATGTSLDLFGKLHDDKYYRAYNIYHREP
ncbi:DUF1788 domain-containing protein [Denitrificimonas caeni]|uniref:DUF1788 domain-containing protein n=1 Tax=Denitrificimonas caeni TaxID=521720 RepID=UPI0003B47147|nr:DUF1788 domain-containing protein [Denitrificimonas caeni]